MKAYYNDNDPYCVDWLGLLMDAGYIPEGDIDERSIEDVQPADLAGYGQCHFFAGIGGWPVALRLRGWPDDRPVWTGSCPCPPFSAAGRQFVCARCDARNPLPCPGRTGYFICWHCGNAWPADARHLWPEFWRLIAHCRPEAVLGEQVAGPAGVVWLTMVRASLEILGYATRPGGVCAGGVGAPQIRNRLWFLARPNGWNAGAEWQQRSGQHRQQQEDQAAAVGLADADGGAGEQGGQDAAGRDGRSAAEVGIERPRGRGGPDCRLARPAGVDRRPGTGREVGAEAGDGRGLDHPDDGRLQGRDDDGPGRPEYEAWEPSVDIPTRGPDGRIVWRPTKPGLFPLADGVSRRMAKLRAIGNAIVPQAAAEFMNGVIDD